jgi:2-polyprenyl-3-methyl-5-hydroxy-6-metoxy-1,4-benzoquinol methylase
MGRRGEGRRGAFFRDRLLFHAAPDLYHRRVERAQRERLAPALRGAWEQALRLPGFSTLEASLLAEIQEYFGLTREEAARRIAEGAESFSGRFAEALEAGRGAAGLERIYDETDLEAFEPADWHAHLFEDGPVNYVLALEASRHAAGRSYLDHGSGIGSGAVLFARRGFDVTLADVSSPMLAFAGWRLERRGLPYTSIHLRSRPLPERRWDVITLLDVLEHVEAPLALVAGLRDRPAPRTGSSSSAPRSTTPGPSTSTTTHASRTGSAPSGTRTAGS